MKQDRKAGETWEERELHPGSQLKPPVSREARFPPSKTNHSRFSHPCCKPEISQESHQKLYLHGKKITTLTWDLSGSWVTLSDYNSIQGISGPSPLSHLSEASWEGRFLNSLLRDNLTAMKTLPKLRRLIFPLCQEAIPTRTYLISPCHP